jgi:hypothetical protein
MKNLILTFGKPEKITSPGDDSVVFRFAISAIDSDLRGSPEETRATTSHRLIVKMTLSRPAAWPLSNSELQKELFEIGRRVIVEKARRGILSSEEQVVVNTSTHSSTPPFDPSRVVDADGAVIVVEKEPRRIGF